MGPADIIEIAPARSRIAQVFIDGEAGTTGLGIRERLLGRSDIRLHSLPPEHRKDPGARRDALAAVDLAILCLPDDASRETASLADGLGADAPRLLDASTAFRTASDWVYGFAELDGSHADRIRSAPRVSNPGCYPTGAIALLRPLVAGGLIPADWPLTINAVSGYSGGGKGMIAEHESGSANRFELYGLGFEHKHVPEIARYAGLETRPVFIPSVGAFRQGMLVSVPLHLDRLPARPTGDDIEAALMSFYPADGQVRVVPDPSDVRLEPEALNGTDLVELRVFRSETRRQALLVARLDNLGKGASGAAVQNVGLMLGLDG